MRWLPYLILAYVALGLQTGLRGFLDWQGASPSFVLLAVIFISVNAPREPALLGCFVMGLMQDLLTQQPLGLYAVAYGLVAMFVVSTQDIVYREHPLTHFSLALIGGLLVGLLLLIHSWVQPVLQGWMPWGSRGAARSHLPPTTLLLDAIYTAALAPFVLWALQRLKGVFGFQSSRRRRAAWR